MTNTHPRSWIAAIRGRVRALFRRDAVEGDFSDEIRFHLEMEAEKNRLLGMSPDEARRTAMLAFGGVERMREEHRDARGTRRLEDLVADVRFALRTLRSNRGFATAVALTMMLGIGATVAVFSVAYGVLLRPLPYVEADKLVRLWSRNDSRQIEFFSVSPADFAAWRERNRVFAAMGVFERQRDAILTRGNEPQIVAAAAVTPEIFGVLGTPAFLGRKVLPSDAQAGVPRVAVLSHELWLSRFGGDSAIVGTNIVLDGQPVAVVGVMPDRFYIPGTPAQIWTPLSLASASPDHGNRYLRVLARLGPGATIESARLQMDRIAEELARDFSETNRPWRVTIMSIPEQVVGRQWRRSVIILSGVVVFVLLIACANAANLQLARAAARRREIALRAALGAGRGRIVGQLLAESVVLAVIGGAAGLALAYYGVSVLRSIGAETIPRLDEVSIDSTVLAFTALVTLASGILFGLVPSLGASRAELGAVLKEGGRGGQGLIGQRARAALVIGQVALSLILLVGAGLLMKSFARLQQVDVGFDPTDIQLASFRPPESRYADGARLSTFYSSLLERTARLPGVESAALVSSAPFAGPNTGAPFIIPERPPAPGDPSPDADFRIVSPNYFRTMGIGLSRGRDFTDRDRVGAPAVVIISEAAVRSYWPGEDPLGRQIQFGAGEQAERYTIVGIVRDARYFGLENPDVRPLIYFSAMAAPQRGMSVIAKTDNAATFASGLRQAVKETDAQLPIGTIASLDRLVDQALATQRFALTLFAIFAGTALLLAAIGIYGVLSYLVRQRTQEMGVRVALGASSMALMRGVVGGAMRFVVPGVIIGLAGAWMLTRLLSNLLVGVSPRDTLTFGAVSLLLTATAVVASIIPARRAARADPMLALRGE
jgi:putative ABC transport system permease protein